MNFSRLRAFPLSAVTFKDAYLVNAFDKELDYLTSFDTDRLLAGFRGNSGLDTRGAVRYGGWENSLIGGHTIGHYLSACVSACNSANIDPTRRNTLVDIITRIIDGLEECQNASGTGLIFGAILKTGNIEEQFDNVEHNLTDIMTQSWVPWYTLHKIFEGLISVTELSTKPDIAAKALSIASKLADWTYGRTSSWTPEVHNIVLGIEYGGMNDCLYDVYMLTGKAEHLAAAEAFDEIALYKKVLNARSGTDVLDGLHANTTIPKFIGALKRYIVTVDEKYFKYARAFWNLVTQSHTYITGDNSEWEHFGKDDVLNSERTNCNCETCNAYNMLKLTRLLYMITGDVCYADWYENTYINTIVSSQNPRTGMTTYFQPMAGGYFKVFGERFTKFWCCVGTGMENFSKLGEGIFYYKGDTLIVDRYVSSSLDFGSFGIEQTTDIPNSDTAVFTFTKDYKGTLAFRLPDWLSAPATVKVDGIVLPCATFGASSAVRDKNARNPRTTNGYAVVDGTFCAGAVITITLPMDITAYGLPDGHNTYAFKYGPVVLSALLGTEDMETGVTGVDVTIPVRPVFANSYLPSGTDRVSVLSGSVDEFIDNINSHMVRNSSEKLSFTLKDTSSDLIFVPHYSQYTERYALYLNFTDETSEEAPAEEATAEEAVAEETPVEEAVAEEISVEEASAEEAPVEEAVIEEIPAEEPAAEEAPVTEAPSGCNKSPSSCSAEAVRTSVSFRSEHKSPSKFIIGAGIAAAVLGILILIVKKKK